jgi:hypothetical protein
VTLTRPTPTAVEFADETPEGLAGTPVPEQPVEQLLARLLGGGEPLPGLPPAKYRVDETTPLSAADVPAMPKMVRGLRFTIAGPDKENSVSFYIHANSADARADFYKAIGGPVPATRIDSLGYVARAINTGAGAAESDRTGTTRIYVVAGQTVIETSSTLAGVDPQGSLANALELASVAVNFINTVIR